MRKRVYRATTDLPRDYPQELSPAGNVPPPPDPPPNSHNVLSRISPSPITVPIDHSNKRVFTTDFHPVQSPSPITVPVPKKEKVNFQPNLSYNTEEDIFRYNNSPITESQYNWLNNRLEKSLEIPDKFTYQTNILYTEEADHTCWFKGYNISCETYDGLKLKQDEIKMNLAKNHKKPGLYRDPLEKYELLWLREIGEGEIADKKNQNIERDWKLLKYGDGTAYRGFTIEPGKHANVFKDMKTIEKIYNTTQKKKQDEDEYQLLLRNYNQDEYKYPGNNVYKKVMDAIAIVKSDKSTDKDRMNAFTYLKQKNNEIDDFIMGGKKRKQTRKRKTSKRKTNKKRNTRGKSRKRK